ncbi:hypothetical protein DL767_004073 [Monosporascus sp. MG133]|nr:hypothetical protein DL767_004073 [Monosporascus sp. MG133]
MQPNFDAKVTIFLGQTRQEIHQSDFLSHVWRHGLDSVCHVCGKDFSGNDILLRTITFNKSHKHDPNSFDITQAPVTIRPIQILNRHFRCLRSKGLRYIPISHAWHEEVAEIQSSRLLDGVDISNLRHFEATRLVFQTTAKILAALTVEFGPIEIWHDYLSVPQWRTDVQQALIAAIPTIYSYPPKTVIHLDDVDSMHFKQLYENSSKFLFLNSLAAITRSRWFQRMWVTLEYLQSNEVIIVGEDLATFNIAANYLLGRLDDHISIYGRSKSGWCSQNELRRRGCDWDVKVSWTDMETWKNRKDIHHTLGGAIFIMGSKKCRDSNDYFIALDAMMGFDRAQRETSGMAMSEPLDNFQRFHSLAWKALENGDYTPLLLTPVEGEQEEPRVPWLRGYSKMSSLFWDLGVCYRKARFGSIIRSGRVQPDLESVGVIEDWDTLLVTEEFEDTLFTVLSRTLQASGTSPEAFCGAIDRIYPKEEMKGIRMAGEMLKEPSEWDYAERGSYDLTRIRDLLENWLALEWNPDVKDGPRYAALKNLTFELMTVLGIECPQKHTTDTRMGDMWREMNWYQEMHGSELEGIARVSGASFARRASFIG